MPQKVSVPGPHESLLERNLTPAQSSPTPLVIAINPADAHVSRVSAARSGVAKVSANPPVRAFAYPHEPLGPSSRKSPIVISEIMYRPAPAANAANLEFVEIYNSNPFFHDIGGFQILADKMSYTFPVGTLIPGGAFLVVAASPTDLQSAYGLTNAVGPYQGNLKKSDTIRLLSETGSVLLSVPYSHEPPCPVAADGTGHSLVLANPTLGEADPRAWDSSSEVGGSPGQNEPPDLSMGPGVTINELFASGQGGPSSWVELFNPSTQTVDLSGCVLTDDAALQKFVIPPGTSLAPGGFASFAEPQSGFGLNPAGGMVFLFKPGRSGVLDALPFPPQAEGVSYGRWPDGANALYPLAAPTPGSSNSQIWMGDVVINELMYHPISGNDDDQYLELYNRGTNTVNLANWQFTAGITFTFPDGVFLAPDSYLVIAHNQANLLATDPDQPPQTLTYNLDPGAPPGVTIDPHSGLFTWTPTPAQAPGPYPITVRVTDSGVPPLGASQSFTVTVLPAPAFSVLTRNGRTLTLAWPTVPGRLYRIDYTDALPAPVWTPLGPDQTATGPTLSADVTLPADVTRFYRLTVLP